MGDERGGYGNGDAHCGLGFGVWGLGFRISVVGRSRKTCMHSIVLGGTVDPACNQLLLGRYDLNADWNYGAIIVCTDEY